MYSLNPTEMAKARDHWNWTQDIYSLYFEIDRDILPFCRLKATSPWLKRARDASQLSIRQVAARLRLTPSTYAAFEHGEPDGKLNLGSLRKCAEALDCELVYALRPKGGCTFGDRVWNQLTEELKSWKGQSINREKWFAWAAIVKMHDPRFRVRNGWRLNSGGDPHGFRRFFDDRRGHNCSPASTPAPAPAPSPQRILSPPVQDTQVKTRDSDFHPPPPSLSPPSPPQSREAAAPEP